VRVWGSYYGEVIRQKWGGQWVYETDRIYLISRGHRISPLDQVRKRIIEPDKNISQYYAIITSQIGQHPSLQVTDKFDSPVSSNSRNIKSSFHNKKSVPLIILIGGFSFFIFTLFICSLWAIPHLSKPSSTPTDPFLQCEFPPIIPDLTFEIIKAHLSDLNISCGPMKQDSLSENQGTVPTYMADCEGTSNSGIVKTTVTIYSGRRPEEITSIEAWVDQSTLNPSDTIAEQILGYIATIPYKNAEPESASKWVESNLSLVTMDTSNVQDPVKYFGGVKFFMASGVRSLRVLYIGEDYEWVVCP
jgi:hypothetical protein